MPADLTPMKKQYQAIKDQYSDCLLFFRLGDFYEMFDEDARLASRELDLTLTTRDRGVEDEDARTPMCGVPYHSAEAYVARLIAKGYKVAICEQTEDPALAKGLVKRDVIRVITPGTVTEASMLEEGRSNYICAVFLDGFGEPDGGTPKGASPTGCGGVAFCDVSTGEFCAAGFEEDAASHIVSELSRFAPREALLSPAAAENPDIRDFLVKRLRATVQTVEDGFPEPAEALLNYLKETQKNALTHIGAVDDFSAGRYMELDPSARRSLELTENLRSGEKKGSLLWVLDRTKTPMGSRLLRSWVERPLLSPVAIRRRLAAVGELVNGHERRSELRLKLREIGDLRRIVSRAVYGTANGRDILALGRYFAALPELFALLSNAEAALLREAANADPLADLRERILATICDEPPFSVREGGILREGVSAELDHLRALRDHGAESIAEIERREREKTGIKKLKVGFNRVFGYYIDVPRSVSAQLPEDYIRKQTLVSNERYFTQELKDLESELLSAKDRIADIEYGIFAALRDAVGSDAPRIQAASDAVAQIDAFCSLAETAARNNYCMPEIDLSREIRIAEGRHPVVEAVQRENLFVPNDTFMNDGGDRLLIITGPNMAGKSTYMRQTALIVLMAQMGSFVPAKSAVLGVVDRVFTRIGASDDLSAGQSTFMVEMTEVAHILRHATRQSLLILDEIGRGTSTYDGMAVARAVLEYCADKNKLGAKTMFATHYHELSALEGEIQGVKNYNITAKKQGGELIFLRKIVPGAADDSYGIEVAKLAGVPEGVIRKANAYLRELERGVVRGPAPRAPEEQVSLLDMSGERVLNRLRKTDPNTLTPIEALGLLFELKAEDER